MKAWGSHITFEERKEIEAFIKDGLSLSEIARRLVRGKNSIIQEVRREGGRNNYCAKKAQKNYGLRNIERKKKIKLYNEGRIKTPNFKTRIESLEMQIEILHETIKGLMSND